MPPTLTTAQIEALASTAGDALQQIQNELGRDGSGGKVRFPRGYLKTVGERIGKFHWMDDTLKRNLCYHMIFADVLRWLLNRTDLAGVAKTMVVKHMIALMGAVAESVTFEAMRALGHGKRNFGKRVLQLEADGIITTKLREELEWLWNARSGVHVYEVAGLELDSYTVAESNRSIRAVKALGEKLSFKFLTDDFEDLGPS